MALTEDRRQRLAAAAERWRDSIELADMHRTALHVEILAAVDQDQAKPVDLARVLGVSTTRIHALIAAAAAKVGPTHNTV